MGISFNHRRRFPMDQYREQCYAAEEKQEPMLPPSRKFLLFTDLWTVVARLSLASELVQLVTDVEGKHDWEEQRNVDSYIKVKVLDRIDCKQ